MPNWLRALIAGYGAKKLGGGCLSTIIVFVIIYFALGQCNHPVVRHGDLKTRQLILPASPTPAITDLPANSPDHPTTSPYHPAT